MLAFAAVVAFISGNDLHAVCQRRNGLCVGYVLGVHDTLVLPGQARPYCVPREVQAGQLEDTVIRYLESHPEKRHLTAASLTVTALMEAFPCPQ